MYNLELSDEMQNTKDVKTLKKPSNDFKIMETSLKEKLQAYSKLFTSSALADDNQSVKDAKARLNEISNHEF